MNIGVCKIKLRLPENHSLKGKRRVIHSITARVKSKFNVSIAEVEDQDLWQVATLGIACVSNHGQHSNEVLSKVMSFIASSIRGDAEVLDYEMEIVPMD
jgi:hypothetical protein